MKEISDADGEDEKFQVMLLQWPYTNWSYALGAS